MKTTRFTGRNSLGSMQAAREREYRQQAREWAREARRRARRARREKRENRPPGVKTAWCLALGCTQVLIRTGAYSETLYVGCHRCKSPNPFKRVSL